MRFLRDIAILLTIIFIGNSLFAQKWGRPKAGECFQIESCAKIDSLVQLAKTKKGCAYGRAGSGPKVFDCSGFTMWVYKQFGVDLPHGSITQYDLGKKVARNDIRPGDLVFFYRSHCVGHVGLVTDVDENGKVTFIHASTYKTGVKFDNLESGWYAKTFVGTRRIFECADGLPTMKYEEPVVEKVETPQEQQRDTSEVAEQSSSAPCTAHTVVKGETLYAIARRYGVTITEIQQWNELPSPDRISEGQQLKIYAAGTPTATNPAAVATNPTPAKPAGPTYHTVRKGENLGVIARRYGVTVSQIQKWNSLPSPDKISEGQKLKIYTSRTSASAPATAATAPATPSTTSPAATPKPTPQPVYHTIKPGETLGAIAQKYHTTVSKLQKLNKMGSSTFLRDGKKLRVK